MLNCYVIFGVKQSGKDSLGDMLVNALLRQGVCPVQLMSFAEPIKEIAIHLVDMPRDVAYGGEKERGAWCRYGRDARSWLQWVGTELGRDQIDKNIWIHIATRRILSSRDTFVITDGRFKNELYDLQKCLDDQLDYLPHKLVSIRIVRPSLMSVDSHISEVEQLGMSDSEFDFVVDNSGTLDDLGPIAQKIVGQTI